MLFNVGEWRYLIASSKIPLTYSENASTFISIVAIFLDLLLGSFTGGKNLIFVEIDTLAAFVFPVQTA